MFLHFIIHFVEELDNQIFGDLQVIGDGRQYDIRVTPLLVLAPPGR